MKRTTHTETDYTRIKEKAIQEFGEKTGKLFPTTIPEQLARNLFGYYYDTIENGFKFENQELKFVATLKNYHGCEWDIYRLVEG